MAQVRFELSSYKSKNLESPNNTVLLDAIDANDTKAALQIIQDDMLAKEEKSIINVQALANTPLLLTLKKGNMTVAEAILAHPKVDVTIPDCRGLTALHWACMLRQDHLIERLLEKNADPHLLTRKWIDLGGDCFYELTPMSLYCRNALLINFIRYFDADNDALRHSQEKVLFENKWWSLYSNTFFKNERSLTLTGYSLPYRYQFGFADRPDLHIPGEMAYTDIIFHMADLCTNLKWKNTHTRFVTMDETRHSGKLFKYNFFAGIFDFCEYRNAIPVNKKLLAQMQKMKSESSDENGKQKFEVKR